MRCRLVCAGSLWLAVCVAPVPALAGIVAQIALSRQQMTVSVDGIPRHVWSVSTARRGYATPVGSFMPLRLERVWYSTIYDNAPMPYAVFFHHGFAVHGTDHVGALGHPASHGCVRLHPANARVLFELIRARGLGNSRIVITG